VVNSESGGLLEHSLFEGTRHMCTSLGLASVQLVLSI
jgi:hypothetical protein